MMGWSKPLKARWIVVLFVILSGFIAGIPAQAGVASKSVRDHEWYLDSFDIVQAHEHTAGAGQTVAVIDTGVDATHPSLAGRVLPGTGIGPDAAPDGRSDSAVQGHGTAMASIIAGDDQLVGIAPAAQILPVSLGGTINSTEMAAGVRWATDHGATVINLSLGAAQAGPASSEEIAAVEYAFSHDVVVVAAGGNVEDQGPDVHSPGNIPGVLTVSGLAKDGSLWSGSSQGPQVVVSAPAELIPAAVPRSVTENGYSLTSGTSSSAAIVSGMVALVRAEYGALDAANVVNRVIRTVQDAGPPGRDDQFGFGIIRPLQALTTDVPAVTGWPLATPPVVQSPPATKVLSGGREPTYTSRQLSATGLLVTGLLFLLAAVVIVRLTISRIRKRSSQHSDIPLEPTRRHYWP